MRRKVSQSYNPMGDAISWERNSSDADCPPQPFARSPPWLPPTPVPPGAGGPNCGARAHTAMSLSGLGSTTADFVTRMERLAEEELGVLWRQLTDAVRSETALQAALAGPRTAWNPYRPARGGANLRQEILNSEVAEFKHFIPTDALFVRGVGVRAGAAPPAASSASSPPHAEATDQQAKGLSTRASVAEEAEVLAQHGWGSLRAVDATAPQLEAALFARVWREVAAPILGQALLSAQGTQANAGSGARVAVNAAAVAASASTAHGAGDGRGQRGPTERQRRHGSAPGSRASTEIDATTLSQLLAADGPGLVRRPTTSGDGRPPSYPTATSTVAAVASSPGSASENTGVTYVAPLPFNLLRERAGSQRRLASSTPGSTDDEEVEGLNSERMVVEDAHGGTSVAAASKRKPSSRQTSGRRSVTSAPESSRVPVGGDVPAGPVVGSSPNGVRNDMPPVDTLPLEDVADSEGVVLSSPPSATTGDRRNRASHATKASHGAMATVHFDYPGPRSGRDSSGSPSPPLGRARKPGRRSRGGGASSQQQRQQQQHSFHTYSQLPSHHHHHQLLGSEQSKRGHRVDSVASGRQSGTLSTATTAGRTRSPLYTGPLLQRFAPYAPRGSPGDRHASPPRSAVAVNNGTAAGSSVAGRTRRLTRLEGGVSPVPRQRFEPSGPTSQPFPERRPTVGLRYVSPLPLPRTQAQLVGGGLPPLDDSPSGEVPLPSRGENRSARSKTGSSRRRPAPVDSTDLLSSRRQEQQQQQRGTAPRAVIKSGAAGSASPHGAAATTYTPATRTGNSPEADTARGSSQQAKKQRPTTAFV